MVKYFVFSGSNIKPIVNVIPWTSVSTIYRLRCNGPDRSTLNKYMEQWCVLFSGHKKCLFQSHLIHCGVQPQIT